MEHQAEFASISACSHLNLDLFVLTFTLSRVRQQMCLNQHLVGIFHLRQSGIMPQFALLFFSHFALSERFRHSPNSMFLVT